MNHPLKGLIGFVMVEYWVTGWKNPTSLGDFQLLWSFKRRFQWQSESLIFLFKEKFLKWSKQVKFRIHFQNAQMKRHSFSSNKSILKGIWWVYDYKSSNSSRLEELTKHVLNNSSCLRELSNVFPAHSDFFVWNS